MTSADFLVQLAADLRLSWPHTSARLLEIAHDIRAKDEILDDMIGSAIAEARRAETEIEQRASAALDNVVRTHRQ